MMTTEAPEGMANANGKNRWFQLGLLSAGAAAPLIARWRSLRAADQAEALREQAETLREQAEARWNEALAWARQSRPQDAIPEALQERLRQAAPQAQESLRQVRAAARDALRRLPVPTTAEAEAPAPITQPTTTGRRVNATLWVVGVGVGLLAAGAVAYVVLRNRIGAVNDNDALVEIPLTPVTAADTLAPRQAVAPATEGPAIIEKAPSEEPGVAEPMPFSEEDAEGAEYVGNILSRVYHPASSKRLPAPQHRTYFATEEEALEAGYRPDNNELASHSQDANRHHE